MCAFRSENPTVSATPDRWAFGRGALAVVLGLVCLPAAADETRAPSTTETTTSPTAQSGDYTLGPGDRIRITVFGHDDLSGEFTISETDTVSFPLTGTLTLGGVALDDAKRAVVTALKPDYLLDPRVSIEVVEYRPFYIIGEVNNPGSYAYVNGMTVTEAVALAGGFTHRAKKGRVVIIRAGDDEGTERSIPVSAPVLPGDVVKVLERIF